MARGGTYQMGKGQSVNFTEFAPDKGLDSPGILLDMINAQPTESGFAALNSPVQFGSALSAIPQGAIVAYYKGLPLGFPSASSVIVGTANHLYRYVGGTPVVIDGGQSLTATSRWRFFQFGDDVIAVANGVMPQVAFGSTGTFKSLTGSPPATATVGMVTLGTTFLFNGQQWYASDAGHDDSWAPGPASLAASGTLYDVPGDIVAAVPFYGTAIVAKQKGMWVGSFAGPPSMWSWQLISADTGTWNQESMILLPDTVAFLGRDDFYLTSGSVPTRIPNSLKQWFFTNVDINYITNTFGWYDHPSGIAYWAFVSKVTPYVGVPDQFVSYNLRVRRWCRGHLITPTVPYSNLSPTPAFYSGFFYFDINNVLQQLTGAPGSMSLTTGFMGDNSRLSQLMRWRARYNTYPTSQAIQTLHTNILGGTPIQGVNAVLGSDDWFNLRQYDRYHQVTLSTVGACEVTGFAFEGRLGGDR